MTTTTPHRPPRRRARSAAVALAAAIAAVLAAGLVSAAVARGIGALGGVLDHGPTGGSGATTVVEVVDGDTIVVATGRRETTVRLIGIDTPETKDPRKPVQCFGAEASRHTADLLPVGSEVRLVGDVEARDRYDRLLAYVYRASDDLFVNLELARGGYADALTYPPNVAHTAELGAAVAEARREQRGLWQACGGPGRPA